jgi:type III secretion protein L
MTKFFSLIYQGDIHAAADEKRIPSDAFSTLLSASEILEKAKEDAATLLQITEKKCEELKEIAKQEGFAEGLALFNAHLLNFDNQLKMLRHDTHQSILPLALKAAKKIVAKELELHPETIVDIVLQTLAPITQSHRVTIYVSKADKEILEKHKPQIRELFEQVQSLSIQERADVQTGGCIIETESGIINATIENQWHSLELAFKKYMKH